MNFIKYLPDPSSGNIAKPRIMSKAKQVNKYKHRDVWQRKCSFSHGFSPNVRFCYVSSRTLIFLVFCRGWGAVRGGFELFRWAQSKRSGAWVRLNRWNISKKKVISNQHTCVIWLPGSCYWQKLMIEKIQPCCFCCDSDFLASPMADVRQANGCKWKFHPGPKILYLNKLRVLVNTDVDHMA